jgi:uncharacterized protein YjiS (DUF1127 family)
MRQPARYPLLDSKIAHKQMGHDQNNLNHGGNLPSMLKELEMSIGHIWLTTNPELRDHLRQANERRAAAFYAVFTAIGRAISTPFGAVIEALRQNNRASVTYRALSRLSDYQLKDIGIWRSEIDSIAQAVATEPPEVEVTLADLRRIRSDASIGDEKPTSPTPRLVARQSIAAHRSTARPASTTAAKPVQAA